MNLSQYSYIKNVHGVKLIYTMTDTGYSYRVSGYKDKEECRKAMTLYPKHRRPYPEHLHEYLTENNMKMLEALRVKIDGVANYHI